MGIKRNKTDKVGKTVTVRHVKATIVAVVEQLGYFIFWVPVTLVTHNAGKTVTVVRRVKATIVAVVEQLGYYIFWVPVTLVTHNAKCMCCNILKKVKCSRYRPDCGPEGG